MSDIKIVSFDLTGTLVDRSFIDSIWFEAIPKMYAEKERISFEQAMELVRREYEKVGDKKMEWYDVNYWLRHFGIEVDGKALLKKFRHRVNVYPEVPGVLKDLGKKYKLIIITNSTRDFLEFEISGIKGHFSEIFSSTSDFKQVKKTLGFYSKICEILGVGPQEVVHVGDHRYFDFIIPRKFGIKAFYLDRTGNSQGKLIIGNLEELKERLV